MAAGSWHLLEVRSALVQQLAQSAEAFVLDPEPAGTNAESVVKTFRGLLTAYEDAVKVLHSSSSPAYALKDLPADERKCHQRALHAIRVLEQVHGPRVGSA